MRFATGAQSAVTATLPAMPGTRRSVGEQAGRPEHHLGGNTAPIRALPAQEPALDTYDVEALFGETAGDMLTPGPIPRTITSACSTMPDRNPKRSEQVRSLKLPPPR